MAAESCRYVPITGPRQPVYRPEEDGPVHAYSLPYEADLRKRAVIEYIGQGWRVIPLHHPEGHGCSCARGKECRKGKQHTGKHPRIDEWQRLASSDPAQVEQWWKTWPLANVGLLTSREGGLLVIDIDPRHGGSLEALEGLIGGPIPVTLRVETGGGGWHVYFEYPRGCAIRKDTTGKLAPGIDVISDGAYVVAPPSRHESGCDYGWRWDDRLSDGYFSEVPLAEVPSALLDRLVRFPDSEKNARSQIPHTPGAIVEADTLPPSARHWLGRAVESAEAGTRNSTGFELACQLRDEGISAEDAQPILLAYAESVENAGDHPYTEREALDSLTSAYSQAPREPARRVDGQGWQPDDERNSDAATPPPLRDEGVRLAVERVSRDCLSVSLSQKTVPAWAEVEQDWDIQAIQDPNRRDIAIAMRIADCLPNEGGVTFRGSDAWNRRQAHYRLVQAAWGFLFPGEQTPISQTEMSEALNAVEQGQEGWLVLDLLYRAVDTHAAEHGEALRAPRAYFITTLRNAVGKAQPKRRWKRATKRAKTAQDEQT